MKRKYIMFTIVLLITIFSVNAFLDDIRRYYIINQVFNFTANFTEVQTPGKYLTGGDSTILINISLVESELNQTIDAVTKRIYVNLTGDTLTGNVNMSNNSINTINTLFFGDNEANIRLFKTNDKIDGDALGFCDVGPTGVCLPHFLIQAGGDEQASVLVRSLMIINEDVAFLNSTNRTSCRRYMEDVAGEILQIDCNTTTTGADLLIGDDLQVVGEVWLKDTSREWHFLTRTLEILDELFNGLLFNSITGTIFNGRLNIVSTDNLTLVVNLNNTETIFGRANDSVNLNQGTNATPLMNFITYQNPSNPVLTVEATHPDSVPHAEVARGLLGAGTNVYGSLTNELGSSDEFIVNVYHRMLEQGALYLSGLFPSVSTTEVNISGGTYIIIVDTKDLEFNLSTSSDFFYVHQNDSFRQSNNLDSISTYANDAEIGNNRYFNVVFGIISRGQANPRMIALLQDEPASEYLTTIRAEVDEFNSLNTIPSDDFLRNVFLPVARVVMKRVGTTSVIQTLDNGDMFLDLRGTMGEGGGSAPSPSITDHGDLTGLLDDDHTQYLLRTDDKNLSQANVLEFSRDFFLNATDGFIFESLFFNKDIFMQGNRIQGQVNRLDDEFGLVLYYPFSNETGAKDYSGNGNDGTVNGAVKRFNGIQGKYMEFDGNDYISIPSKTYTLTNGATTFSFVAKNLNADSSNERILGRASSNAISFIRYLTATDVLVLESDINGDDCRGSITNDEVWHFYVITVENGRCTFYEDGFNVTVPNDSIILNNVTFDQIARSGTTEFFNGSIDEVRIYNRSQTPEQIEYLYVKATQGLDNSRNFTIGNDVLFIDTDNEQVTQKETFFKENIHLLDNQKQYFGDADDVSVQFNGTDYLVTAEVGSPDFGIIGMNVGIGTDTPSSLLSIKIPVLSALSNVFSIFTPTGEEIHRLFTDGSGNGILDIFSAVPERKVRLYAAGDSFFVGGNVGIGTITPREKLDVVGNAIIEGKLNVTNGINVSNGLIVSSGRVGIGTTTPNYLLNLNKGGGGRGAVFVIDYDALNPISTLRGGTILFTPSEQNGEGTLINTDFWNSLSESRLILQSYNNANQLVLHEGGNVGIGTINPTSKLHVVGNTNITTGNLTIHDSGQTGINLILNDGSLACMKCFTDGVCNNTLGSC